MYVYIYKHVRTYVHVTLNEDQVHVKMYLFEYHTYVNFVVNTRTYVETLMYVTYEII